MTISSTIRVAGPFTGTGSQQIFPFNFKVFANTDLLVVLNIGGVYSTQVLTSQYTVSLNADQNTTPGGTVTMLTAPPNGSFLTLTSQVPVLQPTNLANVGNFYPTAVTDALDRSTIQIQQLDVKLQGAVRAPAGEILPTLPGAAQRAGSVLGFDSLGNPIGTLPASGSGTQLAIDLADPSNMSKGVSLVYGASRTVANVAAIRNLPKTGAKYASTTGYYTAFDGGAASYYYVASDTSSPDNGVTILVATDGGRWYINHSGQITAEQCGFYSDGVTVNTSAVLNAANAAVLAAGAVLLWTDGTYIMESVTLLARQMWSGFGSTRSILKAKNGLNADFLSTGTTANVDDPALIGLGIDGNKANNTTGNTVTLKGACPRMYKTTISNSAANALVTDYDTSTALRAGGFEGIFSDVILDTSSRSGLVFNGPNDSTFTNLTIIDPGVSSDNTYYGAYFTQSARATNIHGWNRSTISNTPASMVLVAAGGCNFALSHFEGGHTPLKVQANGCTFSDCGYYAPRGGYCIENYGTGNKFSGTLGIGAFAGNTVFKGVLNSTALSGGADNIYDLVDLGCIGGAIEWAGGGGGGNVVRITGFRSVGTPYVGTPAANDDVLINIQGAGGGTLVQALPVAWTAYTPSITAGSGAYTTVSATGRYRKIGTVVHVEINTTITTNGTAAGYINATLPLVASAFPFVLAGRENLGGKMCQGQIIAGGSSVRIFDYANAYPGASGSVVTVSGTYETV